MQIKGLVKMEKKLQKPFLINVQFIDCTRFMTRSLSNLVNNLAEELIKLNVNMDMIIKHVKYMDLNTEIVIDALNIQTLTMI